MDLFEALKSDWPFIASIGTILGGAGYWLGGINSRVQKNKENQSAHEETCTKRYDEIRTNFKELYSAVDNCNQGIAEVKVSSAKIEGFMSGLATGRSENKEIAGNA